MNRKEINNILDNMTDYLDKNLSQSDEEKILSNLNAILEIEPTNFDALMWMGTYYHIMANKVNYDNAIYYYEQAIAADPNNSQVSLLKDFIEDCTELQKLGIDKIKPKQNKSYDLTSNEAFSNSEDGFKFLTKLNPIVLVIIKIAILLGCLMWTCPSLFISLNDRKIIDKTDYYNVVEDVQEAQKVEQNDTKAQENVASEEDKINAKNGYMTLKVNPVTSYNYLTKKQIYDLRKRYVQNSLFATQNYEPNEGVFGGIVDGKPWWTTNPCSKLNYTGDYHERIEGNSKVSAQMNNPNALVGISLTYSPWELDYNKEFCYGKSGMFLPESLSYNKKENLIVATYEVPSDFAGYRVQVDSQEMGYPLQLSGLNAIDFGYKYVYALDAKNINMMYPNSSNMTNDVQTFADYIHLGGSCRYEGGCNNISPMQNNLMFSVNYLPAIVTLKLWKERPANKFMKADFYYKIIIDRNR